jgi:choline monooxygenase
MAIFDIDMDIRRARTLPSLFYTDTEFFEEAKEKIFARSWQFAGRREEAVGLTPFTLLPGLLDEPLLLTRDGADVKCLSNVCTHRGKILVEQPCEANSIRCGYHGRRFALDGKFLSMPEFEDVVDFPAPADDLPRVETAEALGFLFVSLVPPAPLAGSLSDLPPITFAFDPEKLKLRATRDYAINAHWALYCENYLEGFHIPYVHRSLNQIVDYGSYTTDLYRSSSMQTGYEENGTVAAQYLFIFPNTMLNFYPWGISVNVVKPVSPSGTVVSFLTYVADESKLSFGAGADLHGVEMEDEAVVESVQHGIRSRFYSRGRYSPTREQGTHHFHRLIAEFMN